MSENNIDNVYDAVVIGGGPAGLTAALYLARARYRVLVVEREHFGGQITITSEVVNYPGVLTASGEQLTDTMRRQAEAFGAEMLLASVESLDLAADVKVVHTSRGDIRCLAVLLATGASPRSAGFEGEENFRGHGVAYCATCDGEFFTGREVFVVGGGFAAAEEAVFLTTYASHVTILVYTDNFTCAKATADAAYANEKITVRTNAQLLAVEGDSVVRGVRWLDRATGEEHEFSSADGGPVGVFVFVGYAPATSLVAGVAELDPQGYVITDDRQMTSVDGLFAAGDVCQKRLRQVATAVGEGAATATEMERYLKAARERTGIMPKQPASRTRDVAERPAHAYGRCRTPPRPALPSTTPWRPSSRRSSRACRTRWYCACTSTVVTSRPSCAPTWTHWPLRRSCCVSRRQTPPPMIPPSCPLLRSCGPMARLLALPSTAFPAATSSRPLYWGSITPLVPANPSRMPTVSASQTLCAQ